MPASHRVHPRPAPAAPRFASPMAPSFLWHIVPCMALYAISPAGESAGDRALQRDRGLDPFAGARPVPRRWMAVRPGTWETGQDRSLGGSGGRASIQSVAAASIAWANILCASRRNTSVNASLADSTGNSRPCSLPCALVAYSLRKDLGVFQHSTPGVRRLHHLSRTQLSVVSRHPSSPPHPR